LADDPQSADTQGTANGNLAQSTDYAGEEQVGDVRASYEKDQTHNREQYQERLANRAGG
jgi:hypothetical protein